MSAALPAFTLFHLALSLAGILAGLESTGDPHSWESVILFHRRRGT